jgi:hypothetical protein
MCGVVSRLGTDLRPLRFGFCSSLGTPSNWFFCPSGARQRVTGKSASGPARCVRRWPSGAGPMGAGLSFTHNMAPRSSFLLVNVGSDEVTDKLKQASGKVKNAFAS